MQHTTIALTGEQIDLVSDAAKTLKKDSPEEMLELTWRQKLYEALKDWTLRGQGLPFEKVTTSTKMIKMARTQEFSVKYSDAVVAVQAKRSSH
ncbi:uncharacterized protein BBA_09630 [Beauveria bassiana ARSEF 2860]|uniref:Uncharacterized protein n=1 Tax=Beauveria bassiana (strain ARSEF 2860) TaxID=655819 RepID=J4VS54_BEAB2|nr:uncharacterized protein BBA_09630 [Beauveria bassiana ARSEF 2860]EJP61440.1 hypothetical protein BBA_09630 [Beauveria bassiana ARSEF 2860]